ncbi:protein of unknown function DUF6 transmembrane [Desulfovibrio sp. X2]|uniref:DMT family transporter n=1 Tax=Desulfovibrio sp. X2 TaxID=941449 RepID=UPI000358D4EC|nr:DMT family transporter [Desulfovibrio sp. X2]EPR44078.1 protein of unknown function DUF6 transmembrane [Desulfovibrio sp. X2]
MKNQRRAMAYGLVTVALWSTVASAFKLSLRHMDVAQLLFWSALVSTMVMLAALAIQGRLGLLLSYGRAEWLRALGLGLLNPFVYYLILFKAYDLLPAQEAQPLNYTWAITLALLSVPILGQRLSWRDIAATLVSWGGVLVISTHGDLAGLHFASPLGVACALASTVIWSLYWLLSTRDHRDPVAGLAMNFLCSLPFCLAWACLVSSPLPRSAAGLAGAAYVGLFEMGVTFITWITALRLAENTSRVGNLIFISPFVSLLLIHFLVGEPILSSTFAGLSCIVAGLILQQTGRRAAA